MTEGKGVAKNFNNLRIFQIFRLLYLSLSVGCLNKVSPNIEYLFFKK